MKSLREWTTNREDEVRELRPGTQQYLRQGRWEQSSKGNKMDSEAGGKSEDTGVLKGYKEVIKGENWSWYLATWNSLMTLIRILVVWKWKWSCSVVSNSVTPWTAACQAPPSMGFYRQEYWSGVPFGGITQTKIPTELCSRENRKRWCGNSKFRYLSKLYCSRVRKMGCS